MYNADHNVVINDPFEDHTGVLSYANPLTSYCAFYTNSLSDLF